MSVIDQKSRSMAFSLPKLDMIVLEVNSWKIVTKVSKNDKIFKFPNALILIISFHLFFIFSIEKN